MLKKEEAIVSFCNSLNWMILFLYKLSVREYSSLSSEISYVLVSINILDSLFLFAGVAGSDIKIK